MDNLLLQRAKETLYDAVGFGLADQRVAGGHAPEADLVMEMFGEERAAVVVSQRHAAGGAERWPGESGQPDKWDFCLTRAKMAVEQER